MEALTLLEHALVELVAKENWPGFRLDGLAVVRRENTGAGRYTYLEDDHHQSLPDGTYGAQGKLLELEGVRDGACFVVDVSDGSLCYLEIAVYGNELWDGVEGKWSIV